MQRTLLLLAVLALACSPSQLDQAADTAGDVSRVVVPMSRDAIDFLKQERDRLVTAGLLTGKAATDVDTGLREAEAVLERVERGEKVTREELLKAIDSAALVNDLLKAAGAKPPPVVASALELARRVVEDK